MTKFKLRYIYSFVFYVIVIILCFICYNAFDPIQLIIVFFAFLFIKYEIFQLFIYKFFYDFLFIFGKTKLTVINDHLFSYSIVKTNSKRIISIDLFKYLDIFLYKILILFIKIHSPDHKTNKNKTRIPRVKTISSKYFIETDFKTSEEAEIRLNELIRIKKFKKVLKKW